MSQKSKEQINSVSDSPEGDIPATGHEHLSDDQLKKEIRNTRLKKWGSAVLGVAAVGATIGVHEAARRQKDAESRKQAKQFARAATPVGVKAATHSSMEFGEARVALTTLKEERSRRQAEAVAAVPAEPAVQPESQQQPQPEVPHNPLEQQPVPQPPVEAQQPQEEVLAASGQPK